MKGSIVPRLPISTERFVAAASLLALSCTESADTGAHAGAVAEPPETVLAEPPVAVERKPAESAAAAARAPRVPIDGRAFPDKVVALTWDDGPDANTLELAEYLSSERISATFFVVKAWIEDVSAEPGAGKDVFATGYEYIPILGDLVALGHRVANHTLNHVVISDGVPTTIDYELRENQMEIDAFVTNELHLFRAPGGAWGPGAAAVLDADPYLQRLVGPIRWDVDRKDWENSLYCRSTRAAIECERAAPGNRPRVAASVTAHRYVSAIEAAGHGIVLLHDRVGHVGSSYALDVAQAMIPLLKARGFVFTAPVLHFSPLAPRAADGVWAAVDPSTLRLGDVNGDGRADVCARTPAGVECATSIQIDGTVDDPSPKAAFRNARLWDHTLTDARGWARPEHGPTLDLADVDGDGRADVCGRRSDGIVCALADVTGKFGIVQWWSEPRSPIERRGDFADSEGWGSDESYYRSVHFGDVDGDGKDDVCGRAPVGIVCARSTGSSFEHPRVWLGEMSDAEGWLAAPNGTTVQLADVNGDGRADVCGRSKDGIVCALSNGSSFGKLRKWSAAADFSDGDTVPWKKDASYYGTLRFGDVNGDRRADVCGRTPEGVVCALSAGHAFTKATTWLSEMTDAQGWLAPAYSATIRLGDVNGDGRADICGRGPNGIVCGLAP